MLIFAPEATDPGRLEDCARKMYRDYMTAVGQNLLTTVKAYGDPAGRLSSVTLPNGVVVSYGYDRNSNVTSLTYKTSGGTTLGTLTYGYDADDQRVSVGGSFARTNLPTTAQSLSYNPDNSLKTLGSVTVQNDDNGDITCMVSSPCPQFSYDARGHLQQAGTGVAAVDFSYDALGRRNQLTTAVTNTTYQYDGLNIAQTWFNGFTGQASTYLSGLGLDELFSFTFWNGVTNTNDSVLRDPLNSAVAVTDSSQALQDQYTYDPYGNTSDSGGSSANPFQFTGRENDGNGLYYMRGRYYAPAIGRFISRDPAGFAGGFNLYEYAGDDPVDFSDPTGDWVAIGPGLGCGGDCYGAWSGPDSIAIPHGFVGVPSISQLAPIPNINGFDIQQGRQTNGGLGEPLAQADEDEDENPLSPQGWAEREIDENIQTVEILSEMGRPEWAHSPGGFVNWLTGMYPDPANPPLSQAQADAVVREARKLGVRCATGRGASQNEVGHAAFKCWELCEDGSSGCSQRLSIAIRETAIMNLLILNGASYPTCSPNHHYRGTDRKVPTYCDALPRDHEINQLFRWFLEEGGESGVVHESFKSTALCQTL